YLLGRWTYDVFANYWGAMPAESNPIAAGLNARPKFVASNTLTNPEWSNTTVLRGDNHEASIADLKTRQDGELLSPGGGIFHRWLFANRLVDEMILVIYPVIVGQ